MASVAIEYLLERESPTVLMKRRISLDEGRTVLPIDGRCQEGELTFEGCRFISRVIEYTRVLDGEGGRQELADILLWQGDVYRNRWHG